MAILYQVALAMPLVKTTIIPRSGLGGFVPCSNFKYQKRMSSKKLLIIRGQLGHVCF